MYINDPINQLPRRNGRGVKGHNKGQNMGEELKQFYGSSKTYLERLKRHNEKSFAPYITLCKEKIPAEASILDCGCGTGFSSYLLAKEGFKVTAVDISPLFISEAKKRYGNQPNLAFVLGDVSNLPFSDHTFDSVCSIAFLEHVVDLKPTLIGMCRILKKDGLLIMFMPNFLDPVEHLIRFLRWKRKDKCKPWEAKTRIEALYQFTRIALLRVGKAAGLNKKIYYLKPILSNEKSFCGQDFDATWLTNRFDVGSILRDLGLSSTCIFNQNSNSKILRMFRFFRIPKSLQSFYAEMRASGCVIVGRKNKLI